MTTKVIKLFSCFALLIGFNFTIFGQTLTIKTITEALNYSGNLNSVKKLIITDSILGNDYSVGSEWSKFRTLDYIFPNIESVEILTDQDIPDSYYPEPAWVVGLFYNSKLIQSPPKWLKHFSAPNVKKIGRHAFMRCVGLESVNFPNAIIISDLVFQFSTLISADFPKVNKIGTNAFIYCPNLKSVNFPLVTKIGSAFNSCPMLASVSFGTGFREYTAIDFGINVFDPVSLISSYKTSTLNIDLTLGEFVLPKPNMNNKIWQSDNNAWYDSIWHVTSYAQDYYWKSISLKNSSSSTIDISNSFKINVYPNPTDNTLNVDLNNYKIKGRITLLDINGKTVISQEINSNSSQINTFPLFTGTYFLRLEDKDKVYIESKIIKR